MRSAFFEAVVRVGVLKFGGGLKTYDVIEAVEMFIQYLKERINPMVRARPRADARKLALQVGAPLAGTPGVWRAGPLSVGESE